MIGREGRGCIPLGDAGGTVHPGRGVEVHAVVVEGHGLVERVVRVKEEVIGRLDVERRGSKAQAVRSVISKANKRLCVHSRPCTVDTNDATLCETVGVGILDIGDVPPDLMHAGEGGGDGGKQGECRPHFVVTSVPGDALGEGRGRAPVDSQAGGGGRGGDLEVGGR